MRRDRDPFVVPGTGVIFQPEGAFYEKDWQAFIDKAAAVLAEQEKEQGQ